MTRYVYLLVEESSRELASRQLIAIDCLRHGLEVVIAQQWWFGENVGQLPVGMVLFKGNNLPQGNLMHLAKQHGHLVSSIEEEAFTTIYKPDVQKLFSANAVANADHLFLQGEVHRDFLVEKFPETREKTSIVGNPRTDILLDALDDVTREMAADLREQHGDFVLVNSNSANINPYDIDTCAIYSRYIDVGIYTAGSAGDLEFFETIAAWEHENLREMSRFTRFLAEKRPDTPIYLRPHPSENFDRWATCFEDTPTVHVIDDREHIPWLIAAQVTVHTSCTTGLESRLVGTPTISICPGEHPWHAAYISNDASEVASDADEAVTVAERILASPPDSTSASMNALFKHLERSLKIDPSKRSSAKIAETLAAKLKTPDGPSTSIDDRIFSSPELQGRRWSKAHISLEEFQKRWASLEHQITPGHRAVIEEIAPTVFWIKPEAKVA
jgi:surface carbohydrate biosynthesis protein